MAHCFNTRSEKRISENTFMVGSFNKYLRVVYFSILVVPSVMDVENYWLMNIVR